MFIYKQVSSLETSTKGKFSFRIVAKSSLLTITNSRTRKIRKIPITPSIKLDLEKKT